MNAIFKGLYFHTPAPLSCCAPVLARVRKDAAVDGPETLLHVCMVQGQHLESRM
jgi:hypothetical protein